MRLHVLTAVSRPENLGRVAESLAAAKQNAPYIDVCWHWTFDTERTDVGGQYQKNYMLEGVSDGWVWILDDDTLAHPWVLAEVGGWATESIDAVVVSQLRTDGRVLEAGPQNVRMGFIDVGQAFIRREVIGETQIPLDYNGDFWWLQEVLNGLAVEWVPEQLSLHNAISGVDVSV